MSSYPSKEALAAFEVPDDLSGLGVLPRMIEHMRHHVAALRERGLLVVGAGGNAIRVLPPFIATVEELNRSVEIIRAVLAAKA